MNKLLQLLLAGMLVFGLAGCEALVGAGVAGGAYEYQNKQALDDLEEQYQAGEIGRDEYLQRKEEIEGGSAVY